MMSDNGEILKKRDEAEFEREKLEKGLKEAESSKFEIIEDLKELENLHQQQQSFSRGECEALSEKVGTLELEKENYRQEKMSAQTMVNDLIKRNEELQKSLNKEIATDQKFDMKKREFEAEAKELEDKLRKSEEQLNMEKLKFENVSTECARLKSLNQQAAHEIQALSKEREVLKKRQVDAKCSPEHVPKLATENVRLTEEVKRLGAELARANNDLCENEKLMNRTRSNLLMSVKGNSSGPSTGEMPLASPLTERGDNAHAENALSAQTGRLLASLRMELAREKQLREKVECDYKTIRDASSEKTEILLENVNKLEDDLHQHTSKVMCNADAQTVDSWWGECERLYANGIISSTDHLNAEIRKLQQEVRDGEVNYSARKRRLEDNSSDLNNENGVLRDKLKEMEKAMSKKSTDDGERIILLKNQLKDAEEQLRNSQNAVVKKEEDIAKLKSAHSEELEQRELHCEQLGVKLQQRHSQLCEALKSLDAVVSKNKVVSNLNATDLNSTAGNNASSSATSVFAPASRMNYANQLSEEKNAFLESNTKQVSKTLENLCRRIVVSL